MASNANSTEGRTVPLDLIGWAIPVGLLTLAWFLNWPWSPADFVVAGAIFAIVGGTFELAVRASGNPWYRTRSGHRPCRGLPARLDQSCGRNNRQ